MKRILIVGSPGSGKSTLARQLRDKLNYPVLHLDRVFHIDNDHQVSSEALKASITDFVTSHEHYIIDGSYVGTLEYRMTFADTVIIMDFETEACLVNAEKRRLSGKDRPDMAPGFDNSVYCEEFMQYIRTFKNTIFPTIITLKNKYPHLKYYMLKSFADVAAFTDKL